MKHQGGYVATAISVAAYLNAKKECGPLSRSVNLIKEAKVPDSLKCMICSESMRDAAKIPCCGRSYCDECIRNSLLNSENFYYTNCKKSGVLPDGIEPSAKFRRAVIAFYNVAESSRIEDILKEKAPKISLKIVAEQRLSPSVPETPGTPVLDERPEYYTEDHHIRRLRHHPYDGQ